jgi:acyl-CoA thioesterase FadM
VFTARLEVDYKAPLPAESTVVCRAAVQSFEGRKLWLDAEVADPDSGLVYARSKSLFVIPRGDAGAAAAEAANGSAGAANGTPMAKSGDVAATATS